jgi:SAM-dependent methyltransferase
MRICLACQGPIEGSTWNCNHCGHTPPSRDGVLLFAPELADGSSGFDAKFFPGLASVEAGHFWFRARNRLIQWAFQRYFPQAASFLEIGCGTGYVLTGMREAFPQLALSGSEIFPEGLSFAAERLPGTDLWQMDARRLPFREELDVIGAFDVLEHIEEDETVLAQMYQSVRPGGGILLSVPQHAWLWSETDVAAHHVRRYEADDLRAKVMRAGFEILRATSFVSLLLPPMWVSRLMQKNKTQKLDASSEFAISPTLNRAFEAVMAIERVGIQAGLSFPAGGSLLLAARKV